jgi:hypothetical protein
MWKSYPDDPRYEVSDDGGLRYRRALGGYRIIRGELDKDGYRRFSIGGRKWSAHRLVFRVFCGELEEGLVVAHLDGDPLNNKPCNLVQCTQAENIRHKRKHGTWQDGERHPCAKYTDKQAAEVRVALQRAKRRADGCLVRGEAVRIARELGVGIRLVYDISAGKSWS